MSDLPPEKPPMKHEQVMQRSKTVDGLLDDAVRGANQAARPWSIADLASSSSSWEQLYQSAKSALDQKSLLGAPAEKQTQNAVLSHQLELLDKASASEKKQLVSDLIDNEKHF